MIGAAVSKMATIIDPTTGDAFVGVIDVSGHQFAYAGSGRLKPGAKGPDLRRAALLGVVGVIARVGNGSSRDESFPLVWQAARDAGIAFGAYYYAQPNRFSGTEAAEWTVHALGGLPTDLPIMLDFEKYHGALLNRVAMTAWIRDYMTRVESLTARKPILYAGHVFANANSLAGTFANFDTIQPRYPRSPKVPPSPVSEWAAWIPWDRQPVVNSTLGSWDGWQFSADARWQDFGGPSDAEQTRCDVNIVRAEVWSRWFSPAQPEPSQPGIVTPDPGEQDMINQSTSNDRPWAVWRAKGDDVVYLIWPSGRVMHATAAMRDAALAAGALNMRDDASSGSQQVLDQFRRWVAG